MKKLKYLHMFRDHDGAFRCYVRRAGAKKIAISGKIGSPQFMAAYRAALKSPKVPVVKRTPLPVGHCVYFIRGGAFIKIGKTRDLNARLPGIQTSYPEPLEVLLAIGGGRNLEKALHQKFASLRAEGEWFRAEPNLLTYIDEKRMEEEQ